MTDSARYRHATVDSAMKLWVAIVLFAAVAVAGPSRASADVTEWLVADGRLRARTTGALTRYYSVVRPDSLRVRYIAKNGPLLPYRIRAERIGNDTLGQIVSISLGQLTLTSSTNVRVALGEDLYASLLGSRADPRSMSITLEPTLALAGPDWSNDHTIELALDRVEYRPTPSLAAFVSIGAPESNQLFWADASVRAGLATPHTEFALVLPLAAGATSVGPLRPRLLAPGFGAALAARHGPFAARARFTAITSTALTPMSLPEQPYVHTLSSSIAYSGTAPVGSGSIQYDAGIGFEEYTQIASDTSGQTMSVSRVRRVSPLGEVTYRTPGRNIQVSVGVADLAIRGSFLARLTQNLSVEVRWVGNRVLREQSAFEHPFALFLTPRVTF